jgi:hypothetical protein
MERRKDGKMERWKEGRKEGRKERTNERRREGRKEERREEMMVGGGRSGGRKGRLTGPITSCRYFLLKHIIEGEIERKGRRRRKRNQLLYDLKEKHVNGTRKRKHQISLCVEIALMQAVGLS